MSPAKTNMAKQRDLSSLQARSQVYAAATSGSPRRTTGGDPYGGMQLIVRQPRPFAVGERSANFDTLFGYYIDAIRDPSRARLKDSDIQNRMRQDLQVLGTLNVRKLATAQLKRQWTPANQTPDALNTARRFESWFNQQYRVTEMLMNVLDAILDGISIQEMVWGLNEEDFSYGIDRMFPCYKDRFVFSKDGKLCLLTRGNVYYGEQVHPWQFIQHVYGSSGGSWLSGMDEARLYWGRGLEDNLYPNYFFKTVTLNLMTRWLQRLAGGVFIGRFPFKNKEAQAVMLDVMSAWQEDETFAIPSTGGGDDKDAFGYQIHEGTKAPADTFLGVIDYFDRQISKVVIGSPMIMDHQEVGAQSLGETQQRNTFGRIVEFDRTGIEETMNRSVVPVMGELNHVPKALWPTLGFCLDPANHGGEQLDDLTKLQGLGFQISAEMVSEQTGYRTPRPGETVLQGKPDPMGGFGFLGNQQRNGPGSPLSSIDLSSPEGLNKFRAIVHRQPDHHRGMQQYKLGIGGIDHPHGHTARLDASGNGETDAGPDGHKHEVRVFKVRPDETMKHKHDVVVRGKDMDRVVAALGSN
jgi:phage gp29-like protein